MPHQSVCFLLFICVVQGISAFASHADVAPLASGVAPPAKPAAPQAVVEMNDADWLDERYGYDAVSVTRSYAPLPVFLEGWKSTPRDHLVGYEWDFGDGSSVFEGFNAVHVFEEPGEYTITLTVTDEYGRADTGSVAVEVLEPDGTTYYVDAELGNDENEGTGPGAEAWRTAAHAFQGMCLYRYGPGDRILFTRGQTFPMEANTVNFLPWAHNCGYSFGAFGEGSAPLIQLEGEEDGHILRNDQPGLAFVTFMDLSFDLTAAEGGKATLYWGTRETQNLMFLRCNLQNFDQGFLMQGEHTGAFLVGCTTYNSENSQIYTTCSRVGLLGNHFDYSGNHIAYLEIVNIGAICGNTFSRAAFDRHALRLSGRDEPTTNNVLIRGNTFTGWVDPRTGYDRYNWCLVHLAPNKPELQIMENVVFECNQVNDAETLLNIGNYQGLEVRLNSFTTLDTYQAPRVVIGSLHDFDTVPVKDLHITENSFVISACEVCTTSVFMVRPYMGDPYEGRTAHEDIVIDKNVVFMYDGLSRILAFEDADAKQVTEVVTDNLIVYTNNADDGLYQVNGTCRDPEELYSMPEWRQRTGNDVNSQVYASQALPFPGWASSPPSVGTAPIPVAYRGACDMSGSGLKTVRLWVKKDDGPWRPSFEAGASDYGTFNYPAYMELSGVYHFALQAEDNAGNVSPPPEGDGHCQTYLYSLGPSENLGNPAAAGLTACLLLLAALGITLRRRPCR